jgi:hypothetical protein
MLGPYSEFMEIKGRKINLQINFQVTALKSVFRVHNLMFILDLGSFVAYSPKVPLAFYQTLLTDVKFEELNKAVIYGN